MVIKTFKGNSGCTIHLMNNELGNFIRKKSPNISYNERLLSQCDKQKNFNNGLIDTPKVLREGFEKDLYYFDMEYIIGTKFSDYIQQNSIHEIYPYMDILLEFIKSNNTIKHINPQEMINNKISDIGKKINMNLKNILISDLPLSYCHGDLTLENVIISSKGKLYLIDFLDSFLNSNLIDLSKILQDLIFMWSWRNEKIKPYSKLVLLQEHIDKNIIKEDYLPSYKLMKLNLLRTLPYIGKDTNTYNNILRFLNI